MAALSTGGCADGAGPESAAAVLNRETFIATYVVFRQAALESPGGVLDDESRERVLAENDVTEDELTAFVEAHGGDPIYMAELWGEVQERLQELPGTDFNIGDMRSPGGG